METWWHQILHKTLAYDYQPAQREILHLIILDIVYKPKNIENMHKLLRNYEFQTAVIGTFFKKTQRSLSIGHNWPLGIRKDPIDK